MSDVNFSISVPGLRQLGAKFEGMAAVELPSAIRNSLEHVANEVLQDARKGIPNRSGRSEGDLSASMRAAPSGALGWKVGSRLKYANAVHWGVGPRPGLRGPHNIRRNPFLLDAVEAHRQDATDACLKAISDLARKAEEIDL